MKDKLVKNGKKTLFISCSHKLGKFFKTAILSLFIVIPAIIIFNHF